jgi:FkbM family methyltransferase
MIKKILEFNTKVSSWIVGIGYGAESIEKEIRSFRSFIPNAKVFVDVGANKGLYSEALIKQFKSLSQIHIFEPSNINYELLKSKFKDNKSVIINKYGLADIQKFTTLYGDESGSGLSGLSKRNLDHFGIVFNHQEDIELIRFDEYWSKYCNVDLIDLIKIDVEGHELAVLRGMGNLIRKVKIIQFEFGGCNIDSRTYFQDFWYFFKDLNFDLYRITPIGPYRIEEYKECYERFETTNYFCVNNNLF